jgi:hypothetical protein
MSTYFRLEHDPITDLVSVVEDFDYSSSTRENYLRNPKDREELLWFREKWDAIQYLNEKIKPEHIHPEWVDKTLEQQRLFK